MENNKIHILIVDDDNRIRDLLKEYLKENNYIVTTAEDSENAKKKPGQGVSAEALSADAPRPERARHKGREALFYLCVIVF